MFFDQFSRLCAENGTTPTEFVTRTLKLSSSKTTAWKNGSIPKYEILQSIAAYFNVTVGYLFDGTVTDALSTEEKELLSYYNVIAKEQQQRLIGRAELLAEQSAECQPQPSDNPVITQSGVPEEDPEQGEDRIIYIEAYSLPASAGSGVDLDGCEKEQIAVRETDMTSDANFAIRVSGKSMEPSYHDGDIVLVRTQPEVELGQIGIFTVNDMGYIKQRGKHELISLNRQYDNIPISASDSCYCRGLVIGILDPDDLAD